MSWNLGPHQHPGPVASGQNKNGPKSRNRSLNRPKLLIKLCRFWPLSFLLWNVPLHLFSSWQHRSTIACAQFRPTQVCSYWRGFLGNIFLIVVWSTLIENYTPAQKKVKRWLALRLNCAGAGHHVEWLCDKRLLHGLFSGWIYLYSSHFVKTAAMRGSRRTMSMWPQQMRNGVDFRCTRGSSLGSDCETSRSYFGLELTGYKSTQKLRRGFTIQSVTSGSRKQDSASARSYET